MALRKKSSAKLCALALLLILCTVLPLPSYSQEKSALCGTAMFAKKRAKLNPARARVDRKENSSPDFTGEKKGLIILVQFPDITFSSSDPLSVWGDIANERGYSGNGAMGSVSDYFYDQSYGKFRLNFDVVGPVTAAHDHGYYGDNIDFGDGLWLDQNVGELLEEACRGVADQVSFADYDWDDDGVVEQVFMLYAGHGENDYHSKDSTTIWPHMSMLSTDWPGYENGLRIQDRVIDVYACSNEINRSGKLDGMGTICHEFSHCLGLPDLYDVKTGTSVVGRYDLMSQGSYSGGGWCPVGYSSYERYACGWLTPQPVGDPLDVTGLLPLHSHPDARIYRASEDANDYYIIEYREKTSWDTYFPRSGLRAWYVDYDREVWKQNVVNVDPSHYRVMHMTIDKIPTSVSGIMRDDKTVVGIYDLLGRPAAPSASGLLIVSYSDGTRKVVSVPEH